MGKNKYQKGKEKYEIQELFMVKAEWYKCFSGIIKKISEEGEKYSVSRITVNEGEICSQEKPCDETGSRVDELVTMVLDHDIHKNHGKVWIYLGQFFHVN